MANDAILYSIMSTVGWAFLVFIIYVYAYSNQLSQFLWYGENDYIVMVIYED